MLSRSAATLWLAALCASTAIAAERAPLAPSTKWRMDYAPTECRLLRSFGEGRDALTVQFSRLDVSPETEVTLVGHGLPVTDALVPARLGTTTVPTVDGAAQGFAAEAGFLPSLRFRPNRAIVDALASDVAQGRSTRLQVALRHRPVASLDLGTMKTPLASLEACVDDLVTGLGLDPAEQRSRRRPPEPIGDVRAWFRPADYPAALNNKVIGGAVVIRLVVGPNGAVTSCAVAKAGGDKAFEDLTCRLAATRALFTPAIGATGRPIASIWSQRVFWRPAAPFIRAG